MMIIETYTIKSFVVRGDTTPHKTVLKDMGGKWNSNLTDKKTSEKFGAWLFWADKRDEIATWLKGVSTIKPEIGESLPRTHLSSMEIMLKEILLSLDPKVKDTLTRSPLYHKLFPEIDIDDILDDDDDPVPHQRLLR